MNRHITARPVVAMENVVLKHVLRVQATTVDSQSVTLSVTQIIAEDIVIPNMVGADLVVNCEVFALDEATDRWESRGYIADVFLPNCTPVRMDDGNFLMAGGVADRSRARPEWPAVAISDGENVTEPWTVVRLMDDRLLRFPETTVWVDGANITAISRSRPNGCASPGRVFTSSDFGRTWRGPMCHNLPELTTSKLYVIYTSQKNHSAMTIIPVESLTVERPTE